jgi:pyruvate/2-oxoglutarate dehydrogenase complex dihydrolipoamide acyltransferase (E2) component
VKGLSREGAIRLPHATPSVRAFAREIGADLSNVRASGPNDRVLRLDVAGFAKEGLSKTEPSPIIAAAGAGLPPWPSIDYTKFGNVTRKPLSRIQKISGANLSRNWVTIPHVTNFDKADVTDLEALRLDLNARASAADPKVTVVAFPGANPSRPPGRRGRDRVRRRLPGERRRLLHHRRDDLPRWGPRVLNYTVPVKE